MPPYFSCIYAVGPVGEFGYENKLPWGHIKEDMSYFKRITTDVDSKQNIQNVVIYGRNTFESLGSIPLVGRYNIVVSSKLSQVKMESEDIKQEYTVTTSLDYALDHAGKLVDQGKAYKIFVIGGADLIHFSFFNPYLEYIYETRVYPIEYDKFKADKFLKSGEYFSTEYLSYQDRDKKHIDFGSRARFCIENIEKNTGDSKFTLCFVKYGIYRDRHPENVYLDMCRKVLMLNEHKIDRTGVGTISLWGEHMRFDLSKDGFPLYTTKRVFFKGIVAELLFFLSGKTDSKILESQGINIWKGNTSREYLDKYGFTDYNEGETGKSYGFQWRHFGAEYKANEQLEIGQGGIDQIQWVIDSIRDVKANPSDPRGRRLVVTAWNPMDISKIVLPCCHHSFQFSVNQDKLNCLVTMRSNDLGCGNPYNVASYALLVYMICHLVDLVPGTLVLNLADAHIYLNHIDALKEQLTRPPRQWPKLEIIGKYTSINDFTLGSFNLVGYNPHPSIKMDMAV